MATSLHPPAQQGRISQLLPTVKCSNCSQPVPLSELGEHVCAPLPKPTAASVASTLAGKLQNLVIPPPRQVIPPPRTPASPSTSRAPGPPTPAPPQQSSQPQTIPAPSRTRVYSTSSQGSSQSGRTMTSSPLARHEVGRATSPRINSPAPSSINQPTSPMGRMNSPGPSVRGLPSSPVVGRTRTPSTTGSIRMPPPQMPPPQGLPPPPPRVNTPAHAHQNTPPNPAPPLSAPSHTRDFPNHHQSIPPPPSATSSNFVPPPPIAQQHQDHHLSYVSAVGQAPAAPEPDTKTGGEAGMAGVGRRGFAAAARAAMFTIHQPYHQHQSMHPPHSPSYGGSGSMGFGGVPGQPLSAPGRGMDGRRIGSPGHLDISTISSFPSSSTSATTPPLSPNSGYSSHSPGPISLSPQSITPPSQLPATSSQSRSPSPGITPVPEPQQKAALPPIDTSAALSRLPFFDKFKNALSTPVSATFAPTPIQQRPPSPQTATTKPKVSFPAQPERKASVSSSQTSDDDDAPIDLGLFGGDEDEDSDRDDSQKRRVSSSSSSESEYGLAYADDTDEEDGLPPPPPSKPLTNATPPKPTIVPASPPSILRSTSSGSSSVPSTRGLNIRKKNSIASSSGSSYGGRGEDDKSKLGANEDALSVSRYLKGSSVYSRNTTIDRTMKTVWEDHELPKSGGGLAALMARSAELSTRAVEARDSVVSESPRAKTQRSNTFAHSPDAVSPRGAGVKLPTRARTERESGAHARDRLVRVDFNIEAKGSSGTSQTKKRVRVCLRCEKRIEDGKWVKADAGGGGILCVKCWKNMYLPKCRRCSLPIENQAVSSSDGQLKGKYHKDCFNCNTCHKPFPDKTFYVYEGKPLCEYHYHEANDSLCAATLCGKPIEGPCAISHAGDKYHPEHFTCEYPLSPCNEMLKEYWEVEGRMLCEKHSGWKAGSNSGESDYEDEGAGRSRQRAQKRVTRFIDLASAGAAGLGLGKEESANKF